MQEIRLITYNVNGIRSAISKNFFHWLADENFDIVCLQEVKAESGQFDSSELERIGYHIFWNSAEKRGYSGTAVFTKTKPDNFIKGIGIEEYDREGRLIRLDFGEFTLLNSYFPSGSSGEVRQAVKMNWLNDFYSYIHELRKTKRKIILSGDYNICHKEIDIHDPISNISSSGFLPEERVWMEKFFESGFIDTFRHFNKEPNSYSWWSYMRNSRANNKGWRIDYISVSREMENNLLESKILSDVKHSDHCPVYLKFKI